MCEMLVKLLDLAIPLAGAIVCWLLYLEKLSVKKDKDDNRRFYAKNKKVLLFFAVVLSLVCAGIVMAPGRPRKTPAMTATAAPPAASGFFAADWVKFYGAKDGKWWVSHPAVDAVAAKLLRCQDAAWMKPARRRMFPFSIRFVDAAGKECILFFDTEYGTFDRETVFRHTLTGDEVERFYLAAAEPEKP